jgi:hypothetical protein
MKKIMLTLMAVLSMSISAFASNVSARESSYMLSDSIRSININSLAKYLELPAENKKTFGNVYDTFKNKMNKALKMEDSKEKNEMIDKAIRYDLRNVASMLDSEQYHKYLRIFNATLKNKGIK